MFSLLISAWMSATPVYTAYCQFAREETEGMTKICYYSCVCGTKALNKKSFELCPISAQFEC